MKFSYLLEEREHLKPQNMFQREFITGLMMSSVKFEVPQFYENGELIADYPPGRCHQKINILKFSSASNYDFEI